MSAGSPLSRANPNFSTQFANTSPASAVAGASRTLIGIPSQLVVRALAAAWSGRREHSAGGELAGAALAGRDRQGGVADLVLARGAPHLQGAFRQPDQRGRADGVSRLRPTGRVDHRPAL